MKKSELKEILRGIVKELVQEELQESLQNGLLSNIITEVTSGLNEGNKMILEGMVDTLSKQLSKQQIIPEKKYSQFIKEETEDNNIINKNTSLKEQEINKMKQTKKKLLEEIGNSSFKEFNIGGINPFENISNPIPVETENKPGDPLAGMDPNDPGLDISGLVNMDFINAMNRKKG